MNERLIHTRPTLRHGKVAGRPDDDLVQSPKRVVMPDFGVVAFESRHGPGFYGELRDDYSKFHLIVAGRATWESGQKRYPVAENTLFHIATQVTHRQRDLPKEPVTLYAIHYRPELLSAVLNRELSRHGMLPLHLGSSQINQARHVRTLVQEMLFEQEMQQFGWETVVQARLTDLAVLTLRLARRQATADHAVVEYSGDSAARIATYLWYLRTHFYCEETLDDAAKAVDLSRRQFTELFRKVTGQTWRRYVNGLRLDHAVKLLTGTEKSVTAVAFECGFEDLSHFYHLFRSEYRCTPLECRQGVRPKTKE